jgi:cell division protein FtsI/penicillin-binding protein 2
LILGGVLALWMLGLFARLYQLEIFDYGELLSRAQRQQQRTVEVAPPGHEPGGGLRLCRAR